MGESEKFRLKCAVFFGAIILLICFQMTSVQAVQMDDKINLHYFYNEKCEVCQMVGPSVDDFAENHPDVNYTKHTVDFSNISTVDECNSFFNSLGYTFTSVPSVIFTKGECSVLVVGTNITAERLGQIYTKLVSADGECPDLESFDVDIFSLSPFFVYGAGFISGLSPCVLLILGFISASYLASEDASKKQKVEIDEQSADPNSGSEKGIDNEQSKEDIIETQSNAKNVRGEGRSNLGLHLRFISGFILGTVVVYTLLSLAIIYSLDFLSKFIFGNVIRTIFAILLILLGLWYIIDARNENSRLFKTPASVRKMFGRIISTKSFGSSFVLGIVFTSIKLPCVGAILMALLVNVTASPEVFLPKLVVYFMGVLTPLVLITLLLVFGLNTQKLDLLRTKYRSTLRLVSGILIIAIVLYSIFL